MPEPPLLNPVLSLQLEPRPEARTGGGKDATKINVERLSVQQRVLARACQQFYRTRERRPVYAGKVHLIASMFDDSRATSYTPRNLFSEGVGCRIVAPVARGYLLEVTVDRLPELAAAIEQPTSTASRVDISRDGGSPP